MKKHCNVGDIVKINNKYYQVHQSKFICDGCAFKDEDCFNINRPSCRNKIFVPYVLPQNAIFIEGNNQKQNIMNTISAELALVAEPQAQIEIETQKKSKHIYYYGYSRCC